MNNEFIIRKSTFEDFGYEPEIYQNEEDGYGKLTIFSNYGMLYPDGVASKPIYYFRHLNTDSVRWAGIINLGQGPLAPQIDAHSKDIAQAGDKTTKYELVEENGVKKYVMRGIDKPFEIAYYEDGSATWKEGENGCILDIKATPFPYMMFAHKRSVMGTNIWHQHCTLSGTYEGKPIMGMGAFDRAYMPKDQDQKDMLKAATTYFSIVYSGIREDGKKESIFAQMSPHQNDYGLVFYYIDGEEPICTTKIHLDADFHHLPYAPDDPTVVYTDSVVKFVDKEMTFKGKFGSKGFTATPRFERLGQSHCYGDWWIGPIPYKHVLSNSFTENMDSLDSIVIKAGYKVVD